MKVSGDEEANDDGDDTKKFDAVVRRDAVCEIFGNLAVKNHD